MPSFDIVSEIDFQEVRNAVDQANREISTRFDFKGVDAKITVEKESLTLEAEVDFQLTQMADLLQNKLHKRQIDIRSMTLDEPVLHAKHARQTGSFQHGIDADHAKKLNKLIKESKLKVKSQLMDDKVRVTGKKRDDLQAVISLVKEAKLDLPLQYINFRD